MDTMPKWNNRGKGHCGKCKKEYSCRKKPKTCECGNFLGGKWEEKPSPEPTIK